MTEIGKQEQYVSFRWLFGQTLILIGTIITAVFLISGSISKALDLKADKTSFITLEKFVDVKVDRSVFNLQTRILCNDVDEIKKGIKELTTMLREHEKKGGR